MKVPSPIEAEKLFAEAASMNPGPWVDHSNVAGNCAKIIAQNSGLNEEAAYVLGLLHDIGRRFKALELQHVYCGFEFMNSLGYANCARICLTHSFPINDVRIFSGKNNCTDEQYQFIKSYLEEAVYDDYDKLIQLCDAIALPSGACIIEKRLVDVAIRHGFNDFTIPKWKAFLEIKSYFDNKTGTDIYKVLGV